MFRFPQEFKGLIDVTKPPYNADNTGKTDCTKALCRAIDDIFNEYRDAFIKTVEKVNSTPGDEVWFGFEIRRVNGVSCIIWPEKLPPSKIIYFPNGTYLVSDTVTYSQEHFMNIFQNVPYLEMNCRLRLMGESMDGVRIKLQDSCKGFEYGSDRPVISFMRGEASNIAMTNMIENMTIDIGKNNPGAIGVVHFANNTGAARNLKIISTDDNFRGSAGFAVLHHKASACIGSNIEVIGFDYGFKILPTHFAFFEHIKASHQYRAGFLVGDTVCSINDFESENACPALRLNGYTGHTVCINGNFKGTTKNNFAVRREFGALYLRNIHVENYMQSLFDYNGNLEGDISEYSSDTPVSGLDKEDIHSLNLKIENTPQIPWEAPERWVSVESFGAVADGKTPASDAIQRAFDSGAKTVYFQNGCYLLDKPIEIPQTVERVNFMYCDLLNTEDMKKLKNTGVFKVVGESEAPLILEDLFAFEDLSGMNTLIDHASKRTLVLSDLHTQAISMYFNSVEGGKVFMENVGCTLGGIPGTGGLSDEGEREREEKFSYSRQIPCYHFKGQKVWARQINPERSKIEILNDHSDVWILGYKAEEEGTAFKTVNGGKTEVLGGVLCLCYRDRFPAIINENSLVSVVSSSIVFAKGKMWSRIVEETKGDKTETIFRDKFPVRYMDAINIPLYKGDLR